MQFRRSVLFVLMIIMFIYFEIHSCSEEAPIAPQPKDTSADNMIYRAMDIHFADRQTGWAVGYSGTVMRTVDGGETWDGMVVDSGDFRDVYFIDGDRGWIAGRNGAFYGTSDAGESWERIISGAYPPEEDFSNVWFPGETIGFVQGLLGVYRTEDGGDEWQNNWLPLVPYRGAWDMSFVNERDGFLLGTQWMEEDPVLLYSTVDGGLTWRAVIGARSSVLTGVLTIDFVNEKTGWAGGGVIMKTTNGGQDWEMQLDQAMVREFFFLDEMRGFAVGGTSIVKTVDGGSNWIDISCDDERIRDLRAVYFFDEQTGWVIGLGYEVNDGSGTFQNSVLLHTTDGGVTWTVREYTFDTSLVDPENAALEYD